MPRRRAFAERSELPAGTFRRVANALELFAERSELSAERFRPAPDGLELFAERSERLAATFGAVAHAAPEGRPRREDAAPAPDRYDASSTRYGATFGAVAAPCHPRKSWTNRENERSILPDASGNGACGSPNTHNATTMPQSPYIPSKDAEFSAWLLNFSSLITAAPATYGLTAPAAAIIQAANDAFQPAYALAIDPGTRTAPTVAEKDAQRVSATATVRPYAIQISLNAAVTDENKLAVGVNLPNNAPVPIPPPATYPMPSLRSAGPLTHLLAYADSGAPSGKGKPYGVVGCEVFRSIGIVAAVDPAQATYYNTVTKAPFTSSFQAGDIGKVCTYFMRWTTRSGPSGIAQKGPFSAPLVLTVM